MLLWANFRRFYLYVMTENMKRVLMAHQQLVLTEEVKTRYQLCERSIFSAASLPEFDEAYTRYLRQFIKFNNHLKKIVKTVTYFIFVVAGASQDMKQLMKCTNRVPVLCSWTL